MMRLHRSLRLVPILALLGAADGCHLTTSGDAMTTSSGASSSTDASTGASSSAGTGGAGGATSTTAATSTSAATTTGTGGTGAALPGWTLTWADEFDAPDGSPVDASKWESQVGGDGWGNQEREYYTSDPLNAHQEGGNLVITATKEGAAAHPCWYGACELTSARLQTRGKLEQAYGRFEARIQIPAGQGLWPAFWMLGNDIGQHVWPSCGEIDIMENIGKEPGRVHGSMHGPGYSGGNPLTASLDLPGGARFADGFHRFAVEWEPAAVRFYVDDTLYETRTPTDLPAGKKWVYDHPFFLLLNVAVGGGWPGDPDGSTSFPQRMLVDYVRVYQHS